MSVQSQTTCSADESETRKRKRSTAADLTEFESKCAKYSALINKYIQKMTRSQHPSFIKNEAFDRRSVAEKLDVGSEKIDERLVKANDVIASDNENAGTKHTASTSESIAQTRQNEVCIDPTPTPDTKPIESDVSASAMSQADATIDRPGAFATTVSRDRIAKPPLPQPQRGGAASYVDSEIRAVFEDVVETLLSIRSFEECTEETLFDEVDAVLREPTFLERAARDCFRSRPAESNREPDGSSNSRSERAMLYEFCPFGTREHCAEVRATVLKSLLELDSTDLDVDSYIAKQPNSSSSSGARFERLVADLRARLACVTPATVRDVQFERLDLGYLASQLAPGAFDARVSIASAQRGIGGRFSWRHSSRFGVRPPFPPGPGPVAWPRRDVPGPGPGPGPGLPPYSAYRWPPPPSSRFPSNFQTPPMRYPAAVPQPAGCHIGWSAAIRAGVPDAVLEYALAMIVGTCDRVHFMALTTPFTDEASGDCSYLNTCFTKHETCKFVHYDVDLDYATLARIRSQQSVSPVVVAATRIREFAARQPDVACELLRLSPSQSALLSVRLERLVYPPQWVACDLRTFDMTVLGKFAVLMADPPWDIHMELPYGTITDSEVRRLNVPSLQEEGGLIFLWVTVRAQDLARQCLADWGYQRVDELVWVKTNQLQRLIRTGRTGHWLNHGKEHCLIGIKLRSGPGSIPPGAADSLADAALTARGREAVRRLHCGLDVDVLVSEVRATSRKPDEIYGVLERLSPGTRKIELFGRQHNVQPNWITLGNQLNGVRLVEPALVRRYKEKYGSVAPVSSAVDSTDAMSASVANEPLAAAV